MHKLIQHWLITQYNNDYKDLQKSAKINLTLCYLLEKIDMLYKTLQKKYD